MLSAFHVWWLLMVLRARLGRLTATAWDNGGGMEPAGSRVGYCVSERKDTDYFLEPAVKLQTCHLD